jgi:hypothetical protein
MLGALPHELVVAGAEASRALRRQRFHCILFHGESQYLDEQYELLTPAQRQLPKIYLELEPPRQHPVDSRHVVTDDGVIVVHLSAYNRLMWDNGRSPVRVIEPGIADPGPRYRGSIARGVALARPGSRRSGQDVLDFARARAPLDVSAAPDPLYRFAFHPARQQSLPLELIEAMMSGMPLVALATGEMPMLVRDGENGFVDSDPQRLAEKMARLVADPVLAARLGAAAREEALRRFGLQRFIDEWNAVLAEACDTTLRDAA